MAVQCVCLVGREAEQGQPCVSTRPNQCSAGDVGRTGKVVEVLGPRQVRGHKGGPLGQQDPGGVLAQAQRPGDELHGAGHAKDGHELWRVVWGGGIGLG